MTNAEKEKIIQEQREFFKSGKTLSIGMRERALKKLYRGIRKYENEILEALHTDLGKSRMEGFMCEVGLSLNEITHMLKNLRRYAAPRFAITPITNFAAVSMIHPEPYGNVLIMSPWNYPFLLTISPLVDAIAAGNTAVVKPSAYSPATSAIMEKLIQCSKAGVQVELFIRGICCLRPGIPGETDNITVKSIVGRYLEHSRIFSFGQGADQRLFIGSGDLLNRNLERRVEAFIEVKTSETRAQVNQILTALRNDKEKGWIMQPDGSYIKEEDGKGTSSQEILYQYFSSINVQPDSEE